MACIASTSLPPSAALSRTRTSWRFITSTAPRRVPIERVRWDPPWLGEELDAADGGQAHATPFAPRCAKDQIEEALFARRRDLFSELSVVFMDTTSLRFEGAGGETLGQRGHAKDHRPDLMPLILCVVIDAEGWPICTEIMPGNTADVRVLLPVVDRLRRRFAIGRVCIIADRGRPDELYIDLQASSRCAAPTFSQGRTTPSR